MQSKEERNAKQRKYRAENREKIAAQMKANYEANKEALAEKRATPAGKARAKANHRAATLRRNPDARELFVGTDAERVELHLDRTVTVPIDDRAVPGCPPDPCLTGWTGHRKQDVYPMMGNVFVHRWLWANAHGPIPEKFDVRHLCNNGGLGCLTLSHLSADTKMQNSADRVANRTTARSLRPQTVRGIRWLHSLDYAGPTELARLYKTTASVVRGILANKTYKEVTL